MALTQPGKPAGAGSLRAREKTAILDTLHDTSWNISEAARRLEIGRSTLHRKIKRYGLQRGQQPPEKLEMHTEEREGEFRGPR